MSGEAGSGGGRGRRARGGRSRSGRESPPGRRSDWEGRQAVVGLLQQHGLPPLTAERVADVGNALRLRARRRGIEYAATFDIATAAPVGPVLGGGDTEIVVTPHIRALGPSRRYVSVHTHRMGTAFSDVDLDLLLSHPPLATIGAVGLDGTWYLLSKLPNRPVAGPAVGLRALRRALSRLAPDYLALAEVGAATREEALRRLLDTTWRLLAPALGLRYDQCSEAVGSD